jgi:hypothetical protein
MSSRRGEDPLPGLVVLLVVVAALGHRPTWAEVVLVVVALLVTEPRA